ncbi:MAG: 16S rRNA (cytosine(1402)-N(4))-methyltransferase RsmH [Phycisphaerales bacterium JB060]
MLWMSTLGHQSVLLGESIDLLSLGSGDVYVDATAGLGGHGARAARLVAPNGVVVLNDLDASMLERAAENVRESQPGVRVETVSGSFAGLPAALAERDLLANALLADLGFASPQVDDPERGFSFKHDGPLDMRLDPRSGVSAAELLATASEAEIAEILWTFGEERGSRRIARKVVASRESQPITTTRALADLVRSCTTGGGIDPATRTFQALRIAVNDELGALAALLEAIASQAGPKESGSEPARAGGADRDISGGQWLAQGARVAIISFHSLEDRMVKRAFSALADAGKARRLTRKPIMPGDAEMATNRRARSARLRAIELTPSMEGGPSR